MMAAPRSVVVAVSLGACLAGPPRSGAAAVDELVGTRGAMVERDHVVTAILDRGHARLVVRRTVRNLDKRHDQAVLWLAVPPGSVATGLRTLGVRDGKPLWFGGELMEAEVAARRYEELTGVGGYTPKDPALLSWRSRDELALQVFPVAPFSDKTVEYTLVVPTTYQGGREHLDLGRLGTREVAPTLTVRAARPGDKLFVDGRPYPSGGTLPWRALGDADDEPGVPLEKRVPLPEGRHLLHAEDDDPADDDVAAGNDDPAADDEPRHVDLALGWPGAPLVGGRLAEAVVAPARVLVRYRVEAAPRLGRVPRGAQIVVLLDGSRSMTDDQRAAELAAARAYLAHFDDARVQLVTFARRPTVIEPRPVSAVRATEDLQPILFSPGNGSAVDLALREADRLLAKQPPGPRRVVLLTDLLTRTELEPRAVRDALAKSGAVLHVGVVHHGAPALQVDDDSPWAPVARASGGLVWSAAAHTGAGWLPRARVVYEEWARPLRIRRFSVDGASGTDRPGEAEPVFSGERRSHAGGGASSAEAVESELWEGESASALWIHPRRVRALVVTGELWARPVQFELAPDGFESRLWSALVFGNSLSDQLSEAEMMVLARAGRAVSPVTSYLAIEPGVRPSTAGLTEAEGSEVGGGSGISHGYLNCGVAEGEPSFDRAGFLQESLRAVWRRCGGGTARATVTIEATRAEIVAVRDVAVGGEDATAHCLVEGAWEIELPPEFRADHAAWHVSL